MEGVALQQWFPDSLFVANSTASDPASEHVLIPDRDRRELYAVFGITFMVLAVIDQFFIAPRKQEPLNGKTALWQCAFWFLVGLAFNAYIWIREGSETGIAWTNGYILEYALSLDNVFFFKIVFDSYKTPPGQTYKALFLGVMGAAVFRFVFFFASAEFFRMAYWVQVIFGACLLWSGYSAIFSEEEDEDPQQKFLVRLITRCLPFTDTYDEKGALLTRVTPQSTEANQRPRRTGTMLLFVAMVLQVVDVMFAVDSVTAKLAANPSIYINFTSSVFPMLCLRPVYYILNILERNFRFLKYGVGAVLAMIGVELILGPWMAIRSTVKLLCISSILLASMLLSMCIRKMDDKQTGGAGGSADVESHAEPHA